jgi:ribose transport system permease protein
MKANSAHPTTPRLDRSGAVGPTALHDGRRILSLLGTYQSGGLLIALIVLGAVFTGVSGNFLSASNLNVVLLQVTPVGIIAIPAAMLLLAGYLDLSVGSIAVLGAAVFGVLAKDMHVPLPLAVIAALAVGGAWGALNGYLTAYLGFSPVVVTLGGFAAARGLADAITQDTTRSGFGELFGGIGNGRFLGLPAPAAVFMLLFAVGLYLWYPTPLGRHLTAIGADRNAARAVGVSLKRVPFWVYVASGLASVVGGLILTSELDGASPSIGLGLELQVLTAVLLGGVAFSGGRGSLWGVLFGVLFVGILNNGLILLNVGPYYVNIAVGAVLLMVAGLDVVYQRLERIPVTTPERPDADTTDPLRQDPTPLTPAEAEASR